MPGRSAGATAWSVPDGGQQLICRGMAGFRWEHRELSCRNQGSDCWEVGRFGRIFGSSSEASLFSGK